MRALALLLLLPAAAWASSSLQGGLLPVGDVRVGEPVDPRDPPIDPDAPGEPVLRRPGLEAFPQALGPALGSFVLAERLDSHRGLLRLRLGAADWDVSVAADPRFEVQYLSFRNGETLLLHRLKDLNELRGAGVVVWLDERTAYRFKVSVNIFSPVRGSTLKIEPEPGTSGPKHALKTGAVLDAVKAASFVFRAEGKEYWTLFGTDVDPSTDRFGATRSLLFINEAGMSSKAWPVAEAALPEGAPTAVTLDKARLVLLRGADGVLRIHSPAKGAPSAR
ncbi:MAG: hypothetical protein HYV15_03035 [Elusimicrobia bacterium]|nr:hypothetical protein [Elusimicrobiota bacterium]